MVGFYIFEILKADLRNFYMEVNVTVSAKANAGGDLLVPC